MAKIIDGIAVSKSIKSELKKQVVFLKSRGIDPCLATILVGDDPASHTYVNNKQKSAKEIGILTKDHRLPQSISQSDLINIITTLNNDPDVHGILLQLPLPYHINSFESISFIDVKKDVDGLTPLSAGLLMNGKGCFIPCTPNGIIHLLDYYKIDVSSMSAVVINRSILVGKPLSHLLLERDCTVSICHSKTNNISSYLEKADLIITAVGNRNNFLLTKDMVRDNCIVIDVGTNRENGKLVGDVDFASVKDKASWITPVPGGVGPMTVCMLLSNTVKAAYSKYDA